MIRTLRAELVKLLRRRVLVVAAVTAAVFAVGGALIVLSAATPVATPGSRVSLPSLARAGGGTEVFTATMSFAGTFLFVLFVGAFAVEFSRGTFRTMLLRQPGRVRLLAGKLAAMLLVAAVTLLATEAMTWVVAYLAAPSQGVDHAGWTQLASLGAAVTDLARVLFWVTGYAVLGVLVAVALRSVPVALAVGIAWAGPFEHLMQDAWTPATKAFPGLLLEAFVAGGTSEVSAGRALLTLAAYVTLAAAVAATVFARRDVTA